MKKQFMNMSCLVLSCLVLTTQQSFAVFTIDGIQYDKSITCQSGVCQGTSQRDYINGSRGQDSIFAGTGNDFIFASNGDDYLSGDAGNDILNGGSGIDTINGGDGNDTLYGGMDSRGGGDFLLGGAGADKYIFSFTDQSKYNNIFPEYVLSDGDYVYIKDATFAEIGTINSAVTAPHTDGNFEPTPQIKVTFSKKQNYSIILRYYRPNNTVPFTAVKKIKVIDKTGASKTINLAVVSGY